MTLIIGYICRAGIRQSSYTQRAALTLAQILASGPVRHSTTGQELVDSHSRLFQASNLLGNHQNDVVD